MRPWCGIDGCSSLGCEAVEEAVEEDATVSFFKNMSEVRLAILII